MSETKPIEDGCEPAPPYWTFGRVGLGLVVIAFVAFWGWIYLFAPRENPDRFSTTAYASAAEPICALAQADIDALPSGRRTPTPAERAITVRQGTEITSQMINDLKALALVPGLVQDPKDATTLRRWFEDWEDGYLVDRWAHVEKLENATADTDDRDLAFIVQERVSGGFYTRRIDGLANVNDMESCHVPGDI